MISLLIHVPCCAEESAAQEKELSANQKSEPARQQNEPAVVRNGFVTRLSGHSSGSDGRTFSGQASMQSIPEGKAHLPYCLPSLTAHALAHTCPPVQSSLNMGCDIANFRVCAMTQMKCPIHRR
jgi:hypothetical protein